MTLLIEFSNLVEGQLINAIVVHKSKKKTKL